MRTPKSSPFFGFPIGILSFVQVLNAIFMLTILLFFLLGVFSKEKCLHLFDLFWWLNGHECTLFLGWFPILNCLLFDLMDFYESICLALLGPAILYNGEIIEYWTLDFIPDLTKCGHHPNYITFFQLKSPILMTHPFFPILSNPKLYKKERLFYDISGMIFIFNSPRLSFQKNILFNSSIQFNSI
jgi:hypothetical protein